MSTHAAEGRKIIDEMLQNFGLEQFEHRDMLRNIAEFHHESVNGTGYPDGRKGTDIPLEARIVAVADVFDALTSARPYKQSWTNEQAIDELKLMAGEKLDAECVNALINNLEEIEQIQLLFSENSSPLQ